MRPGADPEPALEEDALPRLEELIPVTARWTDPEIRKGPLSPYARDSEMKTMALLDESLLKSQGVKLTPTVIDQLQNAAPEDIRQLLGHLEKRGETYAEDAVKKLAVEEKRMYLDADSTIWNHGPVGHLDLEGLEKLGLV